MREIVSAADRERACRPGPALTWAPPALTAPETIPVTTANRQLRLDDAKDYVLDLGDVPIQGGVRITGGHHVVIVGGHIEIPRNLGRTGVALSIASTTLPRRTSSPAYSTASAVGSPLT